MTDIRQGQVWKALDPRNPGRTVTVEKVEGEFVFVVSNVKAKSKINVKRFGEKTHKGFELVQDAPAPAQA